MTDTIQSLRDQLAEAQGNHLLIQERSKYVMETHVQLQLIREGRHVQASIVELEAHFACCSSPRVAPSSSGQFLSNYTIIREKTMENQASDIPAMGPIDEELRLKENASHAAAQHRSWLSRGIPALAIGLGIEAIIVEIIFYLLERYATISSPLYRVLAGYWVQDWLYSYDEAWLDVATIVVHITPFWILTVGIVLSMYYFRARIPLIGANRALQAYEEKLRRERLSTVEGRLSYLREEVKRLTHVTARVFLDNEERYEQAKKWREKAEDILDYGVEGNLGEAQSLISSINELIVREEGELRAQRNWRYLSILVIIVYVAVLAVIAIFTDAERTNVKVPVFGIPLSVMVWGATGSLAAILYKFYTEEKRVRFDLEFRWLIARPVIGIIMGAVVYLALAAGLMLIAPNPASNTKGTDIATSVARLEVYWVVAFLAGFSDKFYIKIIDLLVERTVGKEEQNGDLGEKDNKEKAVEHDKADSRTTSSPTQRP
jgi:hypothetical protein